MLEKLKLLDFDEMTVQDFLFLECPQDPNNGVRWSTEWTENPMKHHRIIFHFLNFVTDIFVVIFVTILDR